MCSCNHMYKLYYSLVFEEYEVLITDLQQSIEITTESMVVCATFLVLVVLLPFGLIYCDKSDYLAVQNDDKDDDFIVNMAIESNEVYEKLIYRKLDVKALRIKRSFCWLVCAREHPLLSLFCHFDIGLKRLTRLVIMLFQLALVTAGTAAIYKYG